MIAPATWKMKKRPFRRCQRCRVFVVRMTSRRDWVCLWCERLCPGTNELTGLPYVSVRTHWKTRFTERFVKTGEWTVLWVATAPKKENQQVRTKRGRASET